MLTYKFQDTQMCRIVATFERRISSFTAHALVFLFLFCHLDSVECVAFQLKLSMHCTWRRPKHACIHATIFHFNRPPTPNTTPTTTTILFVSPSDMNNSKNASLLPVSGEFGTRQRQTWKSGLASGDRERKVTGFKDFREHGSTALTAGTAFA